MATAARKPNWFAIWTSVIVAVIVIGVGVAVVAAQNIAAAPLKDAPVAAAPTEDGVVAMGKGTDTVTTYVDFICPACNQFETIYGDSLLELAANDKIKLEVRAVNMLDAQSSTQYSTRAANAFMCVADVKGDMAATYMRALFDQQPAEGTAGLDDNKLVSIASKYGADIKSCQADMTYGELATTNLTAMGEAGGTGTPTVTINGTLATDYQSSQTWFTDTYGK